MHKIQKAAILIILTFSITFTSYATDFNELQEQKTNIQNELDEKNEQLIIVDEELSQNLQQIQKVDENIEQSEKAIAELDKKINELQKQVDEIQIQKEKITKKYNEQKQILNSRLVAIYESGETRYLDVVLGVKSISEFISTYYLITEMAANDIELLEEVNLEKQNIEEKSKQIENNKKELEYEENTLAKTKITLSNTKLLRENYVSKLTQEEQEIQAKISEYRAQINQIETEIRSLAQIVSFGEDYNGGPMMWPIAGHYNVTSNYGMRVHPITGIYKLHTGVDISAGMGDEFTAIANGIVVKAEFNGAYGNMVIIDHGGGVQTLYAHGSEIVANLGQEVKAGDIVLKVGSTGYSTGPHAHFEVRVNGNPVNPLDYVSIPKE